VSTFNLPRSSAADARFAPAGARARWPALCAATICIALFGVGVAHEPATATEPTPATEIKPLPPVQSQQTDAGQSFKLPVPRPEESIHLGPSVTGQQAESLSLEDLENMALRHNPTLVQSVADVSAATGRFVQGSLYPNPILGYQANEMGNDNQAGQQGFFINQEFVRRQKRQVARAVGSREVAYAQQEAAMQRLRVLNDVRSEHYNVLIGERAQILAAEVDRVNRQALEKTKQLYKAEFVPFHDVLQARIQAQIASVAVGNAKNRYLAAWRRLASLIGIPSMEPCPLSGKLEPPGKPLEWETALAKVYAESPQLARAYAMVAWRQAQLEQAKRAVQPNVLSVLGLQHDTESSDLIGNLQIGMPLPLFNKNQGNIQVAFAELRKAEADVERSKLAIRSRLASTFEAYKNSYNEVDHYAKQILPDAQAALDLVIRGYEQQQFDFLTVLAAERMYAKVNLVYLKSLQELGITRITIEGLLLTGSLRESSQATAPEIDVNFSPAFGPGVIPVETDPGS
jgi:cobalt-zinc-cadmium efflux system outer membrane protein